MITNLIKKLVLGDSIRGEKAYKDVRFYTVTETKDWNPDSIAAYNKWCKKFKLSTLY